MLLRYWRPVGAVFVALSLAACSSAPKSSGSSRTSAAVGSKPDAPSASRGKGGYYMDDGPLDTGNVNLDAIADAVPAVEPLHRFANRPYNVFGVDYQPQQSLDNAFEQTGVGSWYGRKFHGQRTSSGEIYDMFAMTAAHPTLPIPSYARVTNPRNGRSVIVRVNDRGPFLHSRVIDLSYAAAYRLGYVNQGSAEVKVEKLTPTLVAQLRDTRQPGNASVEAVAAVPMPVQDAAVAVSSATAGPISSAPSSTSSIAANPAIAPAGGFFLQLGAFSVEDNARAFLSRLTLEFSGQLPNLQVVRKDPHFRLLAGPFRSREEAQTASRQLKDLTAIASLVVTP